MSVEVELISDDDELGLAFQAMLEIIKSKIGLAETIAQGDLSAELFLVSDDDSLGMALQRMLESLKNKSALANSIAKGDFYINVELSSENDELGKALQIMVKSLRTYSEESKQLNMKLQEYNRTLEQKVEERTKALNRTLEKVEEANKNIMESLRYAEMIQRSLLPSFDVFKTFIPDSFVIWSPRDIVGGDIIYAYFPDMESIIGAVVDCTGHGVPGAFMSMIASSGLRKISIMFKFHGKNILYR